MNRNLFNSRKGLGLIFALFGLFVAVPIVGIFAIIGFITYFIILKSRQNESKVEDLRAQVNNDRENQVINTDYGNITNSQRRLEDLKSLYDNGFMTKDEYIEKRNKIIMVYNEK